MNMEGYDVSFENPLDKRFECPICLLAQREPMQTPCGHRYCGCCIIRALNETGLRCPIDNIKCTPNQLFPDNYTKREILSLSVFCNGFNEGCKWKGELRHLKDHLKDCDYAVSLCVNGCSFKGRRKVMLEHILSCPNKSIPCPFCKVFFPRNKTQVHEENCSKYNVPSRFLKGIEKKGESLKWCGKMKWSLRGPQFEMGTCFSVPNDSDNSGLCTANWHGVLNLIPLLEPQAKIFFSIININRHSLAQMNFHIVEKDSGTVCFENCIKNQVNAFMCPVVKSAYGPNWIIMTWDPVRRRIISHLVEIRGHVLKQLLLKLRQQKDSRPRGPRQTSSGSQRPSTAPNIPSVQFAPHVIATSRAHITPSYNQGHPPAVPIDPRVNFDGSLPVVPPTFPAWCSLPAGTAAPGGGSFFTFSTTPSQYLPTHWHPMGTVPHCQLFKHVAPVRGPGSVPYANFPLQDISTAIIPPIVISDVPTHVPIPEEDLSNMPGPSRISLVHPTIPSQSDRNGEGSRSSRNPYYREASGPGSSGNEADTSGEMSPSHSLLSALRGIRMNSSSSNSSPVMSPVSNTSSSSTSSVGSPSSDVSSSWNTSTSTENSPREDFGNDPDTRDPQNYIDHTNSQGGGVGEGLPLVELQQRIRRSRSGNFYLSSHGVPSALEELANAATVLEGRLMPHRRPSEQTLTTHPVARQEQGPIPNTVLQVPIAQESILQPSIFPSVPVFVPPADTLPTNVPPSLPHLAAPIPLAMPHPHTYPSTWNGHNVHHAPPPAGPAPSSSNERPRNPPTE